MRTPAVRPVMTSSSFYPIGIPGQPWGDDERAQWRASQPRQRRYQEDVVPRIDALADRFEIRPYGQIDYAGEHYTLRALRNGSPDPALPTALITGGVHGYETSGIMGALEFLETRAADYAGKANLLVAPCVSPWAYERINRWNYDAIDPNRSFHADSGARECTALLDRVAAQAGPYLLHIDLHETTNSDEDEFRPALAARDGSIMNRAPFPMASIWSTIRKIRSPRSSRPSSRRSNVSRTSLRRTTRATSSARPCWHTA